MPLMTPAQVEIELHDLMASCMYDPLRFVRIAYPWPVKGEPGPDPHQTAFLERLRDKVQANHFDGVHPVLPVRMGLSTGHGVGKTALCAWVVDWIMSTRPHCKGTVTANTADQLEKKTWAGIREWTKLCLTSHWFEINSAIMFRKGYRASWFCAPASCAEENSEAFAGQHSKDSSSFYVFDEASAIPDKIWEVAEGGLTDGEPFHLAFGNPTRTSGYFHRAAFGSLQNRWDIRVIDAQTSTFSNKALIAEWAQDYGEDSDFFRVRVRGLPPNADELQYIDTGRVRQAQTNTVYTVADEPLVCGVDVSGGGSAMTVCMFRRGFDARSIKPIVLTGEQTVKDDRQLVVSMLANALREHQPAAMFIDSAYGAPIAVRLQQMGYEQVQEVNFGGHSPDPYADNARAAMWKATKEWLPKGAIDPQDHKLALELASPGFHLNKRNRLVIESKQSMTSRGVASPDRADALCLTFALPVAPPKPTLRLVSSRELLQPTGTSWMSS